MSQFYSQYGEDTWIVENLRLPKQGVFVEIGAADGVFLSNTKHFEDEGWTGLCIEPHPAQFAQLVENRQSRTMNCAITANADPHQQFYIDIHDPTWSGFRSQEHRREPVHVPVQRLDQALREAGIDHIDVLSIDTEGSELDVWSSFDHNIWQPQIVILEWETQGVINSEPAIMAAFSLLPYRLVHRSVSNLIFERTGT